jgi:hypothetical protein
MVEQLQHVADVLRVLDHKVQLHVEFATHQLKQVRKHKLGFISLTEDSELTLKTTNKLCVFATRIILCSSEKTWLL